MNMFNERTEEKSKNLPSGWYWILIEGYDYAHPCWFGKFKSSDRP